MDDKKNDQLFTGAKSTEKEVVYGGSVNKRENFITTLVELIKHEVKISIEEELNTIESKVDNIENEMIDTSSFGDMFYEEQSNNELCTRDDIRDLVAEELDTLLEELKITRQ
tara:strand:+ start:411 stop:746 length:336 start_codon:yes stop_codon:yes gene_type:complete